MEVILGVIILGLMADRVYREVMERKERAKVINALIAKNAWEMRELTAVDKAKPEDLAQPSAEPEFIHESEASPEQWEKAIKNTLAADEEENG